MLGWWEIIHPLFSLDTSVFRQGCVYVSLKYILKDIFAKNTYSSIIFKVSFFDSLIITYVNKKALQINEISFASII